jgi:D-galactose 1-dehydrogenase
MIGIGIVGLGHIAVHQAAALRESNRFELIAACDTDASQFSVLGESVQTFEDIEDFLDQSELDVIVVSSPNRLHIEHGIKVMESGKWLLMEKPLAETRTDFQRFAEQKNQLSANCSLALHAAFGVETEWFFNQCDRTEFGCNDVSSFSSQFYDPYFSDGVLESRANSLGGSWMDSGINALSVICRLIDPSDLKILDSRMTRVRSSGCTEAQGTVDFEFRRNSTLGHGSIDTNWTLGRDKKQTRLFIAQEGRQIVLDHSAQQVIIHGRDGEQQIFHCDNDRPRLTNHYVGVFADLARQIDLGADNFDYCKDLHKILFDAEEWAS